jgi:hypothetical protein
MTTNGNDRPRHLNDITSIMPAVGQPKHAAPDTGEMEAQRRPPVPPTPMARYTPPGEPHPPIPPRTRSEDRKAQRPGFWRRFFLGEQ